MLKSFALVVAGAAGALQLERWLGKQKMRLQTASVTGGMIDRLNRRLEAERGSGVAPGPGTSPPA